MCLSKSQVIMDTLKFSSILIVLVVLTAHVCAEDRAIFPKLELTVRELKSSDLFPGAKGYAATLTNTTTQAIPIELLQLPPGYSGGGLFYPCAVQFWNFTLKKWQTIRPRNVRSEHAGGGAQFLHSEMKPNETLEVCRNLLMKERIKGGRCARFAFTFHWDHKPNILSKPFVIPDPEKPAKPIQCP